MKSLSFYKYSSTGNDFIVIDNRELSANTSDKEFWQHLCMRRIGVGADGVIFLEPSEEAHFHMRYLNADGGEVAMCGNGTRAISHFFASRNNTTVGKYSFTTLNGTYSCEVDGYFVWVEMTERYDIQAVEISHLYSKAKDCYYINTGVPHCVYFVDDVDSIDVVKEGWDIRNNSLFPEGVNVNFLSKCEEGYKIRTYERGVEDETLSCGTGITACAHFLWDKNLDSNMELSIFSRGGALKVRKSEEKVFFGGQTHRVYKGEV